MELYLPKTLSAVTAGDASFILWQPAVAKMKAVCQNKPAVIFNEYILS